VVALRPAVDAGLWPLALVAVVAVVLGIAVYLRWFAVLLGQPTTEIVVEREAGSDVGAAEAASGEGPVAAPHRGATAVIVLGTGILVLLSVFPGLLLGLLS
jgi:NADH-quinone oxidoreductase subunit N